MNLNESLMSFEEEIVVDFEERRFVVREDIVCLIVEQESCWRGKIEGFDWHEIVELFHERRCEKISDCTAGIDKACNV